MKLVATTSYPRKVDYHPNYQKLFIDVLSEDEIFQFIQNLNPNCRLSKKDLKIMHKTCKMFEGQSAHIINKIFKDTQRLTFIKNFKFSRSIWQKLTFQKSNLSPTEILLKKVEMAFKCSGEKVYTEDRKRIEEYAQMAQYH